MRITLGTLILFTMLFAGCAELHPTAYNDAEGCAAVGGWYGVGGECVAGDT